jgi:hypothetical protein
MTPMKCDWQQVNLSSVVPAAAWAPKRLAASDRVLPGTVLRRGGRRPGPS